MPICSYVIDCNTLSQELVSLISIAALPVPTRQAPTSPDELKRALHGEQLFESVGCAICHRPTVGDVNGIYSDLLLHDMGDKNYDLSPADPAIVDVIRQTNNQEGSGNLQAVNFSGGNSSYSGGSAPISIVQTINDAPDPSTGIEMTDRMFSFRAPRANTKTVRLIPLGTRSERVVSGGNGKRVGVTSRNTTRSIRLKLEPTMITQEWRTPPLWGVADSAPYMHDGRAETLLEAITMHDGESKGTRDRFLKLSYEDRHALLAFLNTLVAPPSAPQPENLGNRSAGRCCQSRQQVSDAFSQAKFDRVADRAFHSRPREKGKFKRGASAHLLEAGYSTTQSVAKLCGLRLPPNPLIGKERDLPHRRKKSARIRKSPAIDAWRC